MSLELWLGFILAAEIILVVPGPTILLVVSQAIAHGKTSAAPLVAGVVAGDLAAMTMSVAGLGMVMAASAALFSVLKWIGAGYLVWLGVRMWRSAPILQDRPAWETARRSSIMLVRSAFVVTALNPKSIAFFVAFLPQFVNPASAALPQLAVLGATFLVLAGVNASLYALFAGQLRDVLQRPKMKRWLHRCGAGVLIGAGVVTAGLRR